MPARALVAALFTILVVGAVAPAAALAASDPSAGFGAEWVVSHPDGSPRGDDAIQVGDDLTVAFAAVDGTAVTSCQVRVRAIGGEEMQTPGEIANGACRLTVRLPDFPDPTARTQLTPGSSALDLCVWPVMIDFADNASRSLRPADQLQPAGRNCIDGPQPFAGTLDFRVQPGGTPRAFASSPQMLSWNPADWGTDMQPLQFGTTWRHQLPAWVTSCWPMIRGSWQTFVRAERSSGCDPWQVRIPGVLPAALPWTGDPGDWTYYIDTLYDVDATLPESLTISAARMPLAASDLVFESNRRAIYPVDLATTRFVTVGEPWRPVFQVSGGSVDSCGLELYTLPPTYPADPIHSDRFTTTPDADGRCTFELPALADGEQHQYEVTAVVGGITPTDIASSGSILGIPEPTAPVIDPPTDEAGGDTGIGVDPGDGNGLAVDLDVVPVAGAASASTRTATATPACRDRAVSTDLQQGGSIPHLAARCPLPIGRYKATATMIDAAGKTTTSTRTFDVVDSNPPTGSVSIAAGAAFTRTTTVNVAVPATDVATGVAQVALSNDGVNWTTRPYAASQAWTLAAGNGTRTVQAKWRDGAGNWSAPKSDTIVLDTAVPTAVAPAWSLPFGGSLSGGLAPVHLAWSGADATSGVARYELSQRTDGGTWVPTSTTATTTVRNLYGHSYQFAVRAIDKAGNTGAWAFGPVFKIGGVSQAYSAVHYTGTWASSTSPTWWGGTAKSSSKAGSTASYTFTGRSIGWVSLKATNRGKAQVFVNGVLKATVDLYSATTQKQTVVWSINYATSASRTVTIKVLGTAGRPRVDVDGFIVGS